MDGRIRQHRLTPEGLVSELCGKAGGLTRAEWDRHAGQVPYRETCP
ncbi:hypothetical protein [Actinomadura rugatobispora]|uniref:Uncharacterized protein n=1 Tax=Actinomadura rugatobispora TaxID=1994 RepID=A0ABW1A0R4_9ACTN|nr:hypothetical protein GCM10010200_011560 [Actinomadura rugatobispora]